MQQSRAPDLGQGERISGTGNFREGTGHGAGEAASAAAPPRRAPAPGGVGGGGAGGVPDAGAALSLVEYVESDESDGVTGEAARGQRVMQGPSPLRCLKQAPNRGSRP